MKLRATTFLMLLGVLLFAVSPALAEGEEARFFAGTYVIKGWEPGEKYGFEPDYIGRATLETWGAILRYRGFIDDQTYAGGAIFDERGQTLSLSFVNGDGSERGVTVLRRTEVGFEGVWAYDNGRDGMLGKEIWIRQ